MLDWVSTAGVAALAVLTAVGGFYAANRRRDFKLKKLPPISTPIQLALQQVDLPAKLEDLHISVAKLREEIAVLYFAVTCVQIEKDK